MEPCTICSPKQPDDVALIDTKQRAKNYAIQTGTAQIVYKISGGEYDFVNVGYPNWQSFPIVTIVTPIPD